MAAFTQRIEVKPNNGVGGKSWTLLATGPKNVTVKVSKDNQPVEFYYQATGLPSEDTKDGFMLSWDDVALSLSIPATDSLYYRLQSGHRSWLEVISQDA